MSTLGMLLAAVGYRNGEYSEFIREADELARAARQLRVALEGHQRAPDPFGELLSTMHNNREFERFPERSGE